MPGRLALLALVVAVVTAGAARAERLRAVSFNVLHGGVALFGCGDCQRLEERLATTIAELRRLDPDVVGLQEASLGPRRGDVAGRIAAALGFAHVRAAAGYPWFRRQIATVVGFDEGPAVLSRFPILAVERFTLAPCGLVYRRAVVCAVVDAPGGPVDVCSTHTEESACQLRSLAERLRARRSARPLVLMGDLNSPPDAPGMAELVATLGLVDAYRTARPDDPGATAWQPVRAAERRARRRVDYVLLAAPEPPQVLESRVVLDAPHAAADGGPLWPSDHYGVLAEARFPARPGR